MSAYSSSVAPFTMQLNVGLDMQMMPCFTLLCDHVVMVSWHELIVTSSAREFSYQKSIHDNKHPVKNIHR